jgi:DNA-binding transcriptional regulator YdaS (Cro superfamily)
MNSNILAPERIALAAQLGISEQYLYQCLTGRKAMNAEEAVRVERESGCRLHRWDLRRADWHRIWPELIGTEGAPPVPVEQQEVVRDAA